jgi:hypothetical protein
MISLRSMVLDRDPLAAKNIDRIFEVFRAQIQDVDSYIFLTAIRGLSAIADIYPGTNTCRESH